LPTLIAGLLFATLALEGGGTASRDTALSTLVETERSFAKTCAEKGVRVSFLQFFAEDGIAFFPEPTKYKEAVKGRPAPDPHAVTLQWEPQAGDVAASGDLGYTTGPSIRTDNTEKDKPKRYGQFFSVWKKQKDGTWKVAVDIGTSTPTPASPLGVPFKESHAVATPVTKEKAMPGRQQEVMELEREFSETCAKEGVLTGYLSRVGEDVRLHRENELPIVGKDAARFHLGTISSVSAWSPMAGEVSSAGDLGYTYGSYELKAKADDLATVEKGYYLHVWKRNSRGEWKLVADVANPQSSEKRK
jgi:ketosteroid isomerase-like protein